MTNPTDANGRQRTPTDAPRLLREAVDLILEDMFWVGSDVGRGRIDGTEALGVYKERNANRMIAAMVDALLSETAVEAGGHRLSRGALFPHAYRTDPEYKRRSDDLAQRVIEAALRSVGATTDCGCTVTDAVDIDQCRRPGCPRDGSIS